MIKKIKILTILLITVIFLGLIGCSKDKAVTKGETTADNNEEKNNESTLDKTYINPNGDVLETRINTPDHYERLDAKDTSFQTFLRHYPLKEDGSPVLLYNGKEKGGQNDHIAVFKLPLENEDLQQCADSVMRMYAEYFFSTEQYEKIVFQFSDGFEAKYTKWRDGYRIGIENDKAYWVKTASYDNSYETFVKYMRIVFAYSGTASMDSEAREINLNEIQAGDVFLKGGSPGHVVMVVDVCENEAGKKAFLLAQGYMPAQEFHLLKNPLHDTDPWYYEEEIEYPLQTPGYVFEEGSLKRLKYDE